MICFGESIDDLNFVTILFIGENSNSKSYIYYQDKELLYEDTNLTEINKKKYNVDQFADNIIDKIIRRLNNETDLKIISEDTMNKISRYVLDTLNQELGEDAQWHQKTKCLKS